MDLFMYLIMANARHSAMIDKKGSLRVYNYTLNDITNNIYLKYYVYV